MAMDLLLIITCLLSLALIHKSQSIIHSDYSLLHINKNFNVLNHGAIGDGFSDDTKAFKYAWEDACNHIGYQSTMQIPQGRTFFVQPIEFHGPCKSNKIIFKIDGNLTAPKTPRQWICKTNNCHTWIQFAHINGLYIDGYGTFDGQGPKWWSIDCKKYKNGLIISHSSNVHISNIMVKDSPNFQISFEDSTWVTAKNLTIIADGDSPNTDGIHIQRSQNVLVYDSNIGTGDDCISIGDGSKYINISRISCGPGHGISIGSLGRDGAKEKVENVVVQNCTFRETTNGVRIKTWQGGKGHVRNVLFEHIKLYGATRPIIIDQFYCPHTQCKNHTEGVEIKNVIYNHIHGTSIKKPYVQLLCSKSVPCKDIFMNDINIHDEYEEEDEEKYHKSSNSHDDNNHPSVECINVRGQSIGVVKPKVSCLVRH
ncbi:unnamed protein product [Cochlearia groenlandica]